MVDLDIRGHGTGVRFPVHVQPRASRTEIAGTHDSALKVRLNAPPVDGAANAALIELLADTLQVPRRAVTLLAGDSSRRKLVEVEGVSEAQALIAFGLA